MPRIAILVLCAFGLVVLGACERNSSSSASWIDDSITQFYPLGWLGGDAHPATRTVEFEDLEGESRASGGMVLTSVEAGGPLEEAGAKRGDVIVGVGTNFLPNRDDSSLDLIRSVETEVSSGVQPISLSILSGGTFKKIDLSHTMKPIEVGLPFASERLDQIVDKGLAKLLSMQTRNGSFSGASDNADETVITCSMAGLALLAGGDFENNPKRAKAISKCVKVVSETIAKDDVALDPYALAWATMLLAEDIGPMKGGAVFAEFAGELPPGVVTMGEGTTVTFGDASGGGEGDAVVQTFVYGDGDMPEGMDIQEMVGEANVQIFQMDGSGTLVGGSGSLTQAEEEMPDGPLWSMEELKELDEERVDRIKPLVKAVERLAGLQGESGGWEKNPDKLGYSARTLTTNQVLMALGVAQRAGAPVAGEVLRRGLQHVRSSTNDGHVFAVSDPGFDRRLEAGRSNGAAAALAALNCADSDEFYQALAEYGDDNGRSLSGAAASVPLHVLNTALSRRQRGREEWSVFVEEFKDVLVSVHRGDGTFCALPAEAKASEPWHGLTDNEPMRTAIWTLVAAMQHGNTSLLTASAINPLQPRITSDGKMFSCPTIAPGGGVIDSDQARELLEQMGIHVDGITQSPSQSGD